MAQVNQPSWDVANFKSSYCAAAVPACIGAVGDSTVDRGAKVPANGANTTMKTFKGVARIAVGAGEVGSFARTPGDRVVMKANGAIAKDDTVFLTSADAGKEGWPKKYTDFATNGAAFILGVAEIAAADGEFVEITLQGLCVKGA